VPVTSRWLPDGRVAFVGDTPGRKIGSHGELFVTDGAEVESRRRRSCPDSAAVSSRTCHSSRHGAHARFAEGSAFVPQHVGGRVEIVRVALSGAEEHHAVLAGDRALQRARRERRALLFGAAEINRPTNCSWRTSTAPASVA